MSSLKVILFIVVLVLSTFFLIKIPATSKHLPLVAMANYGPHSSLQAVREGFKEEMAQKGYIDGQTVRYAYTDVGFESSLIPQMLSQLATLHPSVFVLMTTPVAQAGKNAIHSTPLVFTAVTDPVEAGLIKNFYAADDHMTGASEKQNLSLFLQFSRQLLPKARRVGLLYATNEANDAALLKMLKLAAQENNFEVVALPIDQTRDIPIRMQNFRNKVDLIYVGASGPIQPALPAIAAEANKMRIPVFNVDEDAVLKDQVFASYGVNYRQVGINTGKIVAQILEGKSPKDIPPAYPSAFDHQGFVSRKKAQQLGIQLPSALPHMQIVD